MLLALGCGVAANAQMTFTLADMNRVAPNSDQWTYGTVTCTNSTHNITSIILSMINNTVTIGTNYPQATGSPFTSSGVSPRTILYVFSPAITPAQVVNFVKGMTFTQNNNIVPGANPYVNISVDANPTSLPTGGTTITVWNEHPDGTPHYYVWVPGTIQYGAAYSDAKKYYFQGMRGYLPTITSQAENLTLKNISDQEGWSGGARTRTVIKDTRSTIVNPARDNTAVTGAITPDNPDGRHYRWLCGPETDIYYTYGPTYNAGGAMNNAYNAWNSSEPNDSNGENVMQVNYNPTYRLWNDYAPTNSNILGYFIEFGGSGEAYTVQGYGSYPANPNYRTPTISTTNDQWQGFEPGNKVSTATTFKPNVMRSHVLVIE